MVFLITNFSFITYNNSEAENDYHSDDDMRNEKLN